MSDIFSGVVKTTHCYSQSPTKAGPVDLHADFYFPPRHDAPLPLVVWLHAGGFRTGSRLSRRHPPIAETFLSHGYACAFLDYRLARPPALLARRARRLADRLFADSEQAGDEMQPSFRHRRPLAVVEDVCSFFDWIAPHRADFGLSDDTVLAGSSAGGISVLNTLALAPLLGRNLPPVRSALVLSGGFAYPSFWRPRKTRILAIHNPADERVPFSSIDRLAQAAPRNVTLIRAHGQAHGEATLHGGEPLDVAIRRFVEFDRLETSSRLC